MSSNLKTAMFNAIQSASASESDALALIAEHSNCAVIAITEPTNEVIFDLTVNAKSGLKSKKYADAIDYVDSIEATKRLSGLSAVQYSIESACGSLISDYLINHADLADIACHDTKAWKAHKAACERMLNLDLAFQFPQQWENYWSVIKSALVLGYGAINLQYLGEDGTKRVKARSALQSFTRSMKPETVKRTAEERAADAIQSIADLHAKLDNGIDYSQVELTATAKDSLIAIANQCLTDYDKQSLVERAPVTAEETIRDLLDDGFADLMLAMVSAYNQTMLKTGTNN